MSRGILSVLLAGIGVVGMAQTPDWAVFVDAFPTLVWKEGDQSQLRWYTLDGQTSVVGFKMILESGNRVQISQRLQRYPGTGDIDQLDEYWIESTGSWRLGKQVLPFGKRALIKETVLAARLDTKLLIQGLPIQIAYADNGSTRTRGLVGRIGREAGVSFAFGDHFGIQGSDFSAFQTPSEALGASRGWRSMVGADFSLAWGSAMVGGEFLMARDANVKSDGNRDLTDLTATWFIPRSSDKFGFGWARRWDDATDTIRVFGEFTVATKASLRPYIRFDRDGFRDMAMTVRFRF